MTASWGKVAISELLYFYINISFRAAVEAVLFPLLALEQDWFLGTTTFYHPIIGIPGHFIWKHIHHLPSPKPGLNVGVQGETPFLLPAKNCQQKYIVLYNRQSCVAKTLQPNIT